MQQFQIDKDSDRDDSLFNRSTVALLDDRQWAYIQKRYHMTPRELQVARFVCEGSSNDDIAKDLRIRRGTVKTHLRNIYRRVRVKSKITLLLKFIEDVNGSYLQSKSSPTQLAKFDKSDETHINPVVPHGDLPTL
jgi:DNA-binding CsgD family transcriptional regulator